VHHIIPKPTIVHLSFLAVLNIISNFKSCYTLSVNIFTHDQILNWLEPDLNNKYTSYPSTKVIFKYQMEIQSTVVPLLQDHHICNEIMTSIEEGGPI
jgi:hypothetical protein